MAAAFADPRQDEGIEVKVQVAGGNVIVDLSLVVPATRQQVWAVLTDFDHMAGFDAAINDPNTGEVRAEFVHNTTVGGAGDKWHPNRLGYLAMGAAIDIRMFNVRF